LAAETTDGGGGAADVVSEVGPEAAWLGGAGCGGRSRARESNRRATTAAFAKPLALVHHGRANTGLVGGLGFASGSALRASLSINSGSSIGTCRGGASSASGIASSGPDKLSETNSWTFHAAGKARGRAVGQWLRETVGSLPKSHRRPSNKQSLHHLK